MSVNSAHRILISKSIYLKGTVIINRVSPFNRKIFYHATITNLESFSMRPFYKNRNIKK